jgi:hypothetical protein
LVPKIYFHKNVYAVRVSAIVQSVSDRSDSRTDRSDSRTDRSDSRTDRSDSRTDRSDSDRFELVKDCGNIPYQKNGIIN